MAVDDRATNPLIFETDEGLLRLTDAGKQHLRPMVTDIDSAVYSFTDEANSVIIAAAMARLSRNSNDLRTIIASEFAGGAQEEDGLIHRVVTEYGDDSVMQLYPMPLVFEGISNIATKEVEWGRFAAYLEQSTRYLRFDRKDEAGRYAYYTPGELDDETTALYEKYLDQIFDIYSALYKKLYDYIMKTSEVPEAERDGAWKRACHAQACDGVRALLPAATKATVGVVGSSQAIQNLILHLDAHELPEMQRLADEALQASRQIAPAFFERTDRPDRGKLISGHQRATRQEVERLAEELIGQDAPAVKQGVSVDLVSAEGDENELIAKILTDHSAQPYEYWQKRVAKLSAKKKQAVITAYVGERYNRRAKPGRAFEFPHYFFEIQCDYGAFRDIQRHRVVDGLKWQKLQTALGHITPPIIGKAKLTKEYERAFALSQAIYDELIVRGYQEQAQYVTLFGHIMRFSFKVNARSLVHTAELRTSPQGHPSYRKIYQDMHEAVAAVHPNIAKAMIFVSQSEDEELARLGAERYQQARDAAS